MLERGLKQHLTYDERWSFWPEGVIEAAFLYKFAAGFRIIYRGRNMWSSGDLLGACADAMALIATVEESKYEQRRHK